MLRKEKPTNEEAHFYLNLAKNLEVLVFPLDFSALPW